MVRYGQGAGENAVESLGNMLLEYLGYSLFVLMGAVFGFFGAGGAILAVPLMTCIFKIPLLLAITYSLAIVGCAAFVGAMRQWQNIDVPKALIFGIPTIVGMFMMRYYLLPLVPTRIGSFETETVLLVTLAFLMFISAYFMIAGYSLSETTVTHHKKQTVAASSIGFFVGLSMGLIGGGGGFMNVPTLTLLLGVPLKRAITTSLLVGSVICAVGFWADPTSLSPEQSNMLTKFIAFSLCGILLGTQLNRKVNPDHLKKWLGFFILVVASFIVLDEFYFK